MTLEILGWYSYSELGKDLMGLVPDNAYVVIDKGTLYDYLPNKLKGDYYNKLADKHLLVKTVDKSSGTLAMININRIDKKHKEIDQDQWGLVWRSGQSTPSASGALYSHGSWKGRTKPIDIPNEWIEGVLDSGLGNYIPITTLPSLSSGSIDDLESTSHWYAIDALKISLKY